jgi:hypothetical protein
MSDFGVFLLMFAGVLLLVMLIKFFSWLTSLQDRHGSLPRAAAHSIKKYVAVNHYADAAPVVMSRAEDEQPPIAASSLQTRPDQTPDRPLPPRFTPEIKLDTYRLLRKYGIPRDEARPMLQTIGMGLDNNLWSKAAPPEPEPAQVTPIAGRPTDADFPFEPIER